jgi:membrane-bound ClpP family serine protease
MSKFVESFVSDAIQRMATPEAKSAVQTHILSPLVSLILETLQPYLLGFGIVWTLLLGAIFILLLRRPVGGIQ